MIYYYGNWETFNVPSNHTIWYIQWKLKDTQDVERMAAIAISDEKPINLVQVIEHIVMTEKHEPKGISRNFRDFM